MVAVRRGRVFGLLAEGSNKLDRGVVSIRFNDRPTGRGLALVIRRRPLCGGLAGFPILMD